LPFVGTGLLKWMATFTRTLDFGFFVFFVGVLSASIVDDSLASRGNSRDVFCTAKGRVFRLNLEVIGCIEVMNTISIRLFRKAFGCLLQGYAKSISFSVIKALNQF
jgi:hypothetical protein